MSDVSLVTGKIYTAVGLGGLKAFVKFGGYDEAGNVKLAFATNTPIGTQNVLTAQAKKGLVKFTEHQ